MNRSIVLVLTCVSLFAMVHNMSGQESSNKYEGLDHIIISVPNLERGMTLFTERTGVAPMRGQHPGRSTENALISFGSG
jgi:Glyoxalase-like domain